MQMPYVTMFCSHFVMLNLFQHQDDFVCKVQSHYVILNLFQDLSADKDKTRLAVRC